MIDRAIVDALQYQHMTYPAPEIVTWETDPVIRGLVQYGLDVLRASLLEWRPEVRPAQVKISVITSPDDPPQTRLFAISPQCFRSDPALGDQAPYQAIGEAISRIKPSTKILHYQSVAPFGAQPSHARISMMQRLSTARALLHPSARRLTADPVLQLP